MKAIEIHLIQNFAPSCLNRDDTNSPKDCIFGGIRRARISSQCIKRSIREHFQSNIIDDGSTLTKNNFSKLTKRIKQPVIKYFEEKYGNKDKYGKELIEQNLENVLQYYEIGFDTKKPELTKYMIFYGSNTIDGISQLIDKHWDKLSDPDYTKLSELEKEKKKEKDKEKKESLEVKIEAIKNNQKIVNEDLKMAFNNKQASDIALFGRMIADAPNLKVDAACQVAHAISTHKTEMEMDFFTAVDDLKPEDVTGSDMMGTVEFNSSCFYRYAVIDWDKLKHNLGGDVELAKKTVEAFLTASYQAIPTGKQNTFAAQNPPSFMMATCREGMPWSLANAFDQPVKANGEGIIKPSITALDAYWQKLKSVNGDEPQKLAWSVIDPSQTLENLKNPLPNFKAVVNEILGELS